MGSAPPGAPCGRGAAPAPASDGDAVLAWVDDGVWRYMTTVASFVLGNTKNAFLFVRCDSVRSTAGGEIPQNLPRRHLRRFALAGFSRFCGSLALRTFQCSPLRGSAFQRCAYCSCCLQLTPQTPLPATNRLFTYIRAVLRNLFRRPCALLYERAGLHSVAPRKGFRTP